MFLAMSLQMHQLVKAAAPLLADSSNLDPDNENAFQDVNVFIRQPDLFSPPAKTAITPELAKDDSKGAVGKEGNEGEETISEKQMAAED